MSNSDSKTTRTSDPIDILLGHNHWATGEILRRCEPLTSEQFHERFDIGPGTLHDTTSHIVGAVRRWAERIDGRARPANIGQVTRHSVHELIRLNNEACADFSDVVKRARPKLDEVREWVFGSDRYHFNVAGAIIHVTNHGMHHRAQCMNMLKKLGQPVNADLDELEWQMAGEP